MKLLQLLLVLILSAPILFGGGCVTREIVEKKPRDEVTLMVGRAGEDVTIQWKSQIGRTYTVLYSERMGGGSQWKPLPGATNIAGTGDMITIRDEVPNTMQRYYRLHVGRLAGTPAR